MQRKTNIRVDASGKLYVEPLPPIILTPEEKLKQELDLKAMDEGIREFFKDGVDLSNYNSR